MNLTNQQLNAIDKFKKMKVGALFMKQGTGKTRVAIELANLTDCELVVFIVPSSLVKNLKDELSKWNLLHEYVIETYQGIAMSDNRYLKLFNRMSNSNCMIIADESIFIKNDNSKTYKRMMELQKLSTYRLILNGTPITKNEWDIYNQINFLSPKIINMHRQEFLNTFFTHIIYKKKGQKEKDFYKLSEVNVEYLHKLLKPYIFQVDLDVDIKESNEMILIGNDVINEYNDYKQKLLIDLEQGESELIRILRKMEYLIFTDKFRLKEIAQKIKGQCIVFCQFLSEIDFLSQEIKDCYVIKGDVPAKDRNNIIEEFKHNNIPLLITLGTGAFGLNLQFCNHIMFSSISFNYAHIEQAIYRIKRLGQSRNIKYTYFTSELGIYNMIYENIYKKKTLQEIIIKKMEDNTFEKEL